MTVEYSTSTSEAFLKISSLEVTDEASYKCEITYLDVRENCDVVQIIKLTTYVIPESVRILNSKGESMGNASMLGPYDEGTFIELTCQAHSGRPTPKVSWYNGTTNLKAPYSSHENGDGTGTGTSKLQFTLSRGDLSAKFECRVESAAMPEPIVSFMRADVNVKPTGIVLSGVNGHVVQGSNVMLICDVIGARPAADVKWLNGSQPITDQKFIQTEPEKMPLVTKVIQNRDGTFTTKSSFIFQASRYENGNAFHCYAENSVMKNQQEPALHEVLALDVYYPPVVQVSPPNITTLESGNVIMLCTYISNPMTLFGVTWTKNGQNLTIAKNPKYAGGTIENLPLVIQNVSREDMGEYSCTCKNEVGSTESDETIYLNVEYPPSVEVIMDPQTPVKVQDQANVTLVCSVTSGNPSTLLKVRWYLGGALLKELPDCEEGAYASGEDGDGSGSGGGQFCEVDPSLISLQNVVEGMAGNYTCQGMNTAGWGPESDPAELIVYYPPKPAKLRFTPSKVIKTASVTLECSVDHPGRPENITYLWYRGTYQVPDVTTANWTISPVLFETKSNFTCIASNEGGRSEPASKFINVEAPPAFIRNLPSYQGVLMTSKNISLTCRVECSPMCSVTWFKDGQLLNVDDNLLYYITNKNLPADVRKNDFESIESTLVWNMTAWPGQMLDRTAPLSNYTCQSSSNGIGPGVNSTIEMAVDYPPENLTVSKNVVFVVENHKPEKVTCSGKGHPALSFVWRQEGSTEPIVKSHILNLGAVPRSASGKYICEASNRHGNETTNMYLNVQYAPSCTLETTEFEGGMALECTAHANPQEVTFTWKIKGENDSVEGATLVQQNLKGYLKLDSSVDSFRTYQCFVNNSVGISSPCERDVTAYQEQSSQIGVPGVIPWWKQFTNNNIFLIIVIVVCLIFFVIVICIIIWLVCRRKRANNKYTNAVEMEEREKPDGQSPDTSGSKWPLKPGVLVHVNKMHSLSQLTPLAGSQYKTTSVPIKPGHRAPYIRSGNKVYERLEKLKEWLGLRHDRDALPFGVYRGSAGVVTFKKFKDAPSSPTQTDVVAASRKRKKPGLPPNPSSTQDKGVLGAAPPGGGSADPLTDPDNGFYENLPFHGMQSPPNKPVSVISPIIQGNAIPYSPSTKSLIAATSLPSYNQKKIQRNQSFHGFQTYHMYPQPNSFPGFNHWPSFYHMPAHMQFSSPNLHFMPPIFYNLPRSFHQSSGANTVSAIRTNPQINPFNYYNRVRSFSNLPNPFSTVNANPFMISNPFNQQARSVGRSDVLRQPDIRRTASGINLSTDLDKINRNAINPLRSSDGEAVASPNAIPDNKRFNSLEMKKHKCYSPTFYSMRCKKHAKKRPIIYAIPKVHKTGEAQAANKSACQPPLTNDKEGVFEHLTDSIQILEQNDDTQNSTDSLSKNTSCPKHGRTSSLSKNTVSAPVFTKNNSVSFPASQETSPNCKHEDSITQALIHKSTPKQTKPVSENKVTPVSRSEIPKISSNQSKESNNTKFLPKISDVTPKVKRPTPTVKVSPNFIKPKVESPKGALHQQLQAKLKASAAKSDLTLNSCTLVQRALSQTSLNQSNSSLNKLDANIKSSCDSLNSAAEVAKKKCKIDEETRVPAADDEIPELPRSAPPPLSSFIEHVNRVPKMPLLDTQNKWNAINHANNTDNNRKNAFYTLTTPHLKQLTQNHQQYSATIPHQKHMKLIPRSLFQDPQISKSKSFTSKSKPKKHFQIPLQKCHSFKFQTAESYFQPIKNIHEENLMRNGYISDLGPNYPESHHSSSRHKRDKHHHQKTNGPLLLRHPNDYQENMQFQENVANSVQLQYPQPVITGHGSLPRPNGVVYADLDMPQKANGKKSKDPSGGGTGALKSREHKAPGKAKTEYATLQFNDVGQEIDV
ncbi:uncharacterized protein nrm isoform X4 [Atheta coriaria]